MAYHNLLSKNDRALVAWLIAQGAGTPNDVFPAKRSYDKPLPCTIVWSEKGKETAPYSGVYTVKTCVLVKSPAAPDLGISPDEPPLDSDVRVKTTFDALHADLEESADKLATEITAVANAQGGDLIDYTCLGITFIGPEAAFEEHGAAWIDTFELEMIVCPARGV